jgi:23S rRNA pseudouridine1911/1915/1917 synthase
MDIPVSDGKVLLEVPRRLVDKRLDVAVFDLLQKKMPEKSFSRGSIARLIKEKKVLLNGFCVEPNHLVKLHDIVEVSSEDLFVPLPLLEPREDIDMEVLYEDTVLVAVNKEEGIQIHPAGNIDMKTVAHWVITKYPEVRGIGENALRPGIVHRLDRETSGVLVIAKTEASFKGLKELFQTRKMEKTYIALVYGHMPALEGQINKPLIRHSGELKRFVVETQYVPEGARQALTLYRVIARYKDFDLLSVKPKSGRTHQIRVHLASLGCPIVGDKLYAFKSMRRGDKLFSDRQMLHAYRLEFTLFSKKYAFKAPLPEDFRSVIQGIEATSSLGETRVDGVDETVRTVYDDEALKSLLME